MKAFQFVGLILALALLTGMGQSAAFPGPSEGHVSAVGQDTSAQAAPPAGGDIITAASCLQVDVQAAIDQATDRDIVVIPPCSGITITTPIRIADKSLQIIGAGVDKTILWDGTSNDSLFKAVIPDGKSVRFSQMSIHSKAGTNSNGVLSIAGGTKAFRVDHIKFDMFGCGPGRMTSLGTYTDPESTFGVVDNNLFVHGGNPGCNGVSVFGHRDREWTIPLSLGTANAVYVEDNVFEFDGRGDGAYDIYDGSRLVFRYNRVTNTHTGNHGHDSSTRSSVSTELYGNAFHSDLSSAQALFGSRGGTGVIFDNTASGNYAPFIGYQSYRSCPTSGNGGCEGTATNTDNSSTVLFDSSTTFGSPVAIPLDRNYAIYNLTDQSMCVLSAYTEKTATCGSPLNGGARNYWQSGGKYVIGAQYSDNYCVGYPPLSSSADGNTPGQEGYPCIDQVGRSPAPSGPQILSPYYAWSNNFKGDPYPVSVVSTWQGCPRVTTYHILPDRDFYDEKESNSHLNVGLYVDIPATCMENDAYFATDQGARGTLYQCTESGTWEKYYTPYTYPHPLTQDVLLTAAPLEGAARLDWQVVTAFSFPISTTWRIEYTAAGSTPVVADSGLVSATNTYLLPGLTNGVSYTVSLNGIVDVQGIGETRLYTATASVKPGDSSAVIFLPLVMRGGMSGPGKVALVVAGLVAGLAVFAARRS